MRRGQWAERQLVLRMGEPAPSGCSGEKDGAAGPRASSSAPPGVLAPSQAWHCQLSLFLAVAQGTANTLHAIKFLCARHWWEVEGWIMPLHWIS